MTVSTLYSNFTFSKPVGVDGHLYGRFINYESHKTPNKGILKV